MKMTPEEMRYNQVVERLQQGLDPITGLPPKPPSKTKVYVGDGVYLDYREECEDYVLTTENGFTVLETIYLDNEMIEVIFALMKEKEASRGIAKLTTHEMIELYPYHEGK